MNDILMKNKKSCQFHQKFSFSVQNIFSKIHLVKFSNFQSSHATNVQSYSIPLYYQKADQRLVESRRYKKNKKTEKNNEIKSLEKIVRSEVPFNEGRFENFVENHSSNRGWYVGAVL